MIIIMSEERDYRIQKVASSSLGENKFTKRRNIPGQGITNDKMAVQCSTLSSNIDHIELQLRKEIKRFLHTHNPSKSYSWAIKGKRFLKALLTFFQQGQESANPINQQYSLSAHLSFTQQSPGSNRISNNKKIIKSDSPLLFILTIHRSSQAAFSIELLTYAGKVIYSKNLFKNWQTIILEMQAVKSEAEKTMFFVANRDAGSQLMSQNKQFKTLMEEFEDLETVGMDILTENSETNQTTQADIPSPKRIRKLIDQYLYIKSCLTKLFCLQGSINSPNQAQAIIIISNLLAILPLSTDSDIYQQMKVYKATFVRAIRKCLRWDLNVSKWSHYPQSLENAQVCRICKQRVYIYCPTCSLSQKKKTCLCANCYESYHRELPNMENDKDMAFVEEWKTIDEAINRLYSC